MPNCCIAICQQPALEEHHIFPTHLGGEKSGPTVWLCSNCHRNIHLAASRIYRGKPPGDFNPLWLEQAAPLIGRIVRALREFEGADDSQIESRLIIKIPRAELRAVHLRKMDLGFSSLENYVLALIRADLPL